VQLWRRDHVRHSGRAQQRAAAIVPADLVERYEELVDREDGGIASERLADLDAGRVAPVSAEEVTRALEQGAISGRRWFSTTRGR
jgi:ribosomal protein S12 methylthiotransferase accessory factor YcaO